MKNAKSGHETERKFLIRIPAGLEKLQSGEMSIIQTYLKRKDPEVQRRVRKITRGGETEYVYTEKKHLSGITREETEYFLTAEEYAALYREKDGSLAEVIKTRHFIDHEGQHFEMDVYPFSDRLATIELELSDEKQRIIMPPFIDVIKEVTGDPEYFNAALSGRGAFPDDADCG